MEITENNIEQDFALFEGIMEEVEANERENEAFFDVSKNPTIDIPQDEVVNVSFRNSSCNGVDIDGSTTRKHQLILQQTSPCPSEFDISLEGKQDDSGYLVEPDIVSNESVQHYAATPNKQEYIGYDSEKSYANTPATSRRTTPVKQKYFDYEGDNRSGKPSNANSPILNYTQTSQQNLKYETDSVQDIVSISPNEEEENTMNYNYNGGRTNCVKDLNIDTQQTNPKKSAQRRDVSRSNSSSSGNSDMSKSIISSGESVSSRDSSRSNESEVPAKEYYSITGENEHVYNDGGYKAASMDDNNDYTKDSEDNNHEQSDINSDVVITDDLKKTPLYQENKTPLIETSETIELEEIKEDYSTNNQCNNALTDMEEEESFEHVSDLELSHENVEVLLNENESKDKAASDNIEINVDSQKDDINSIDNSNTEEQSIEFVYDKEEEMRRRKTHPEDYDEMGDRRYNLRELEILSEDESEYVNFQEVQKARAELTAYTKDFQNYAKVVTDLEKDPKQMKEEEQQQLKVKFDLSDSENEKSSKMSSPKSAAEKNGKKNIVIDMGNSNNSTQDNESYDDFIKMCKVCKKNIYEYSILDEIMFISADTICEDCQQSKVKEQQQKKQRKVKTQKLAETSEEYRTNKSTKPKLESRLKETENETIKKWLEEKEKKEKERRKYGRRERREMRQEKRKKKKQEGERKKISDKKVEEWTSRKERELREKRKNISVSIKMNLSKPIIHNQNKKCFSHQNPPIPVQDHNAKHEKRNKGWIHEEDSKNQRKMSQDSDLKKRESPFEVSEENSFENFRQKYLNNSSNTPNGYTSIKSFVDSVITTALEEMDRDYRLKQARLKRPKSHVQFKSGMLSERETSKNYKRMSSAREYGTTKNKMIPSKPKSANPYHLARSTSASRNKAQNNFAAGEIDRRALNRRFLRSKTFGEWLTDKNGRVKMNTKEKEINDYYDQLEEKLLMLETERRQALLNLTSTKTAKNKLPDLKRLEPQGSETDIHQQRR